VKRSRGRGRRPQNNNSNGNNSNPNRTFDSNGPEIKIRGSAAHVYEKYLQMARDANTMGDRVMAENYLQHAEHYFRILAAAQAQQQQYQQNQQNQPHNANGGGNGQNNRPPNGGGEQPYVPGAPSPGGPSFSLADGSDGMDEDDAGNA
jgi:hypothetical protein